jgi:hypothetical protein
MNSPHNIPKLGGGLMGCLGPLTLVLLALLTIGVRLCGAR